MTLLLPRLPATVAGGMIADLESTELTALTTSRVSLPPEVTYAASGGSRVDTGQLSEFTVEVRELAVEFGWPVKGKTSLTAEFDSRLAALLADHPLFQSGEALRDEVWACVSICLLPDIVLWRFGFSLQRFQGGIRNTFQRLWIRGKVFDQGKSSGENRWALLNALTEDALVAITERPSLSADKRLALALARAWYRRSREHGNESLEAIMRRVALKIRLRAETELLSELSRTDLEALLEREFLLADPALLVDLGGSIC